MSRKGEINKSSNQIKKGFDKEETVTSLIGPVQALEVFDPESETLVPSTDQELKKSFYENIKVAGNSETPVNLVYQVVYPDDLNLKPPVGTQKSKKGRPKKPKIQVEPPPPPQKTKIKVVSKTRSGREVKFPKFIENEFKKIEINDNSQPDTIDIKISDFVTYTETDDKIKTEPPNKLFDQPDPFQKKRRIAAQYRCPKCKKAYLGRSKILEHLRKNPSHGPMHQNEEKNFEVWNYLVNVTQKCPSSERGQKFCQELSNLLHNLLLLTNALFKKLGSAANEVKIDEVLGNAIGLTPGSYYFDDNNLYKNVTVLKLMANNDFLNSIKSKTEDNNLKTNILSGTACTCGKRSNIDELFLKSMLVSTENDNIIAKPGDNNKVLKLPAPLNGTNENINVNSNGEVKKFTEDEFFVSSDINLQTNFRSISDFEIKNNLDDQSKIIPIDSNNENCKEQISVCEMNNIADFNGRQSIQPQSFCRKLDVVEANNVDLKTFSGDEFFSSDINLSNNFSINDFEMKHPFNSQTNLSNSVSSGTTEQKPRPSSSKIKIQSNILICPPRFSQKINIYSKSPPNQDVNDKSTINPELLTDNSILIPHLRHTVDELMLAVPAEPHNILDNSSSSDEVMNVDQFVNERFRKITESDMEVTNGGPLNLELPSLDLFQFHTS